MSSLKKTFRKLPKRYKASGKFFFKKKCIQHFAYFFSFFRVFIGIRKLLAILDMARQTDSQNRILKFLSKLEEEGALGTTGCQ